MLRDDRSGLMTPGFEFVPDPRGVGPIEVARRLAAAGLIQFDARPYVLCVNPQDRDYKYVREAGCEGRIFLDARRNELNDEYCCPSCGRTVWPSRKKTYQVVVTEPRLDGLRQFVSSLVQRVDNSAVERQAGVWPVVGAAREARVCWVDVCTDPALYQSAVGPVFYLVANDLDQMKWVPSGLPRYRLADLVLNGPTEFTGAVRAVIDVGAARRPAMVMGAAQPAPIARRWLQSWDGLTVYKVDDTTVSVRIEGYRPSLMTFAELGLKNNRTATPNEAWVLLLAICASRGHIPVSPSSPKFETIKQHASQIRKKFRSLFSLDESPLTVTASAGVVAHFKAEPQPPAHDDYADDQLPEIERDLLVRARGRVDESGDDE